MKEPPGPISGVTRPTPPLVMETDIGRDPDDLFALLYLIDAGADLRAVLISPGDRDQVAVANWVLRECGMEVPVGSARPGRSVPSASGFHLAVLDRFGFSRELAPDARGMELGRGVGAARAGVEAFICGPPESIGAILRESPDRAPARATVQGGFLAYSESEA